ncbi:hypothetical protein CONPUDRAFT_78069 [Coniophora puteana RWD-64-598 SS2]|uniref:Uncharacterized protein n=1 Tax=Coniophora puteana (strain RWD-64-598) TaxID=741705 RepID=R7SE20_CONPW|nr:uncharacterized protein CONPUDRAFT_78069 [Coniophora puteana RWD-64-598 SS2]EIW74418.1 hypothetical protein CONPUDRAFT_78069 [Coniophora puteana RWD-64-598 SS2]
MTMWYILLRYGGLLFATMPYTAVQQWMVFLIQLLSNCSAFWEIVIIDQTLLIFTIEVSQFGNILSSVNSIVSSRHMTEASEVSALLNGSVLCRWRYSSTSQDFVVFIVTTLAFEITVFSLAICRLWASLYHTRRKISLMWHSDDLLYLVVRENLAYFCISTVAIVANATGTLTIVGQESRA